MMKKINIIWLVVVLFLVGCRDAAETPAPTPTVNPAWERISVEEAEELVRDFFNHEDTLMLKEITPDEVWKRMGFQIFKVYKGYYLYETFLISDRQVKILGTTQGGLGVTDICVTDLNQDGEEELIYVYSSSHGSYRANIGIYFPSSNKEIGSKYTLWGGDLALEKVDDQTLYLYTSDQTYINFNGQFTFTPVNYLGQITLTKKWGKMILSVVDEEGNAILEEEY